MYYNRRNFNISQYFYFYCRFDQIHATLVSLRDFQKALKILTTQYLLKYTNQSFIIYFFLFEYASTNGLLSIMYYL